jgi:hypothetical protein
VRKADVRQVPASAIWRLVTGWTSQVHWVPRCYSLQIFRTRFLAVSMFCFSQSLWIPLVHPLEIGNRCFFLQRKIFEESDFRGHGTWRGTVSRTASVVVSRLRWEGRVQRFGLALCGRHIIAVWRGGAERRNWMKLVW